MRLRALLNWQRWTKSDGKAIATALLYFCAENVGMPFFVLIYGGFFHNKTKYSCMFKVDACFFPGVKFEVEQTFFGKSNTIYLLLLNEICLILKKKGSYQNLMPRGIKFDEKITILKNPYDHIFGKKTWWIICAWVF